MSAHRDPLTEAKRLIAQQWPRRHDYFSIRMMVRSLIRTAKQLRDARPKSIEPTLVFDSFEGGPMPFMDEAARRAIKDRALIALATRARDQREAHPGVDENSAGWVDIVKDERHGPSFGSSVVLTHIGELIKAGIPIDPDACPYCAQLVVSLRKGDRP